MLIGIDGTGPWGISEYRQMNHNSLVAQVIRDSPQSPKTYLSGPTIEGDSCYASALATLAYIKRVFASEGVQKVFLAGHSRGGAICIAISQLLQREKISVECMMLFDAVDRSYALDVRQIPGNVAFAYHAMRSQEVGSRIFFDNCGTSIEAPGHLVICHFKGTHAAMGGTPWTGDHPKKVSWMNAERDYKAANEVKTWSWMMMRRHGVV